MLENDLEKLFRLEASADQPPSQISVPAAGRDPRPWQRGGRALSTRQTRRTRLIVAIGSPVLAAAAVAAILASGTLLSTGPARQHAGAPATGASSAGASPPRAPTTAEPPPTPLVHGPRLDPLRVFASFGWLPAGMRIVNVGNSLIQTFIEGMDKSGGYGLDLDAYPAGRCHLQPPAGSAQAELNCTPSIFGGPPLVVTGTAPDIAGHRAYWVTYSGETYLAWRYSARGWALLESPSAVKIAQHITFGSSAASASLRFAAQLTGLPKGWQVSSDRFVPQDGVPLAVQFQFTKGPQADEPGAGDRALNSLVISAMPPAQGLPCDLGNHIRVIDGYKVTTGTSRGNSHLPQEADLCAPSADGLYIFVQAYGLHPVMGAVTAFRHLRLLGANPANWTTSPVG